AQPRAWFKSAAAPGSCSTGYSVGFSAIGGRHWQCDPAPPRRGEVDVLDDLQRPIGRKAGDERLSVLHNRPCEIAQLLGVERRGNRAGRLPPPPRLRQYPE